MARLLRALLRYGRDQQHLLPAAGGGDICRVETPRAARVRLRGQGEPVPHAHEEAEGPARSAAAVLLACEAPRARLRSRALPAAAALAGERRASGYVPENAPAPASAHDRVPRPEL